MPNPDGTIQSRSLVDKVITSELLDDVIQSDNFSPSSAGWKIERDTGRSEFNGVNIILGSDGILRTSSSGQRVVLSASVIDRIDFYTGDSFEAIPGFVRSLVLGSGATRTLQNSLHAPSTTGDADGTQIRVRSESNNDSTTAPGVVFAYGGGSSQTPEFHLQNDFRLIMDDLGTAPAPAMGIGTNGDDGFYSPADSQLGTVIGGNETVRDSATRTDFNIGALDFVTLPVKTDTGDPSSPQEGDIYVNTSDNVLRLFADAAWRTVFSW